MKWASFAFSVLVLFAATSHAAPVSVQCLTKGKKVIPLYSQCGQLWTTNIKLPDLLVINRGPDLVTVSEVEITGLVNGREVVVNRIADDLSIEQVTTQFRKILGTDPLNDVLNLRLAPLFGAMAFGNTRLSETEAIHTDQSAIILLSNLIYFSYTGLAKVDDLRVTVSVKQGEQTTRIPCPVAFIPYQSKGDYILPVKGDVCLANLPMNLGWHRRSVSQEFAIDVIEPGIFQPSRDPNAEKTVCRRVPLANKKARVVRHKLTDYTIFHREVMAAGDGVVVEIGDKFPESLVSDPSEFSEERSNATIDKLTPEIGFRNSVCGNYIVIDHENGEFSNYCHLSEGTLRVKVGGRVRKGDVIAKVGNTGHSSDPHLHFQLMDGKDMLTANGLPVMFSNVPSSVTNQFCSATNSLSTTDYLLLRVDE